MTKAASDINQKATQQSSPTAPGATADVEQVQTDNLTELQLSISRAQESERRALADYQNLLRRTQDDRLRAIKFANRELLSALIQPLDHLGLAAAQLKDPGLDMVVQQFSSVLELAGLQEIPTEGEAFDPVQMEAVEAGENKQKVLKCIKKGFTYHGEVLQPAKVVVD